MDVEELMEEQRIEAAQCEQLRSRSGERLSQFAQALVVPEETEDWLSDHPYREDHRSEQGLAMDELIPKIRK